MQLSENFTLEELIHSSTADNHHINNYPDKFAIDNLKKLATDILQPIRNKYGKPIYVNSGYRCPQLNRLLKGSTTSQHLNGSAADIDCSNNQALWNIIVNMIQSNEITVGQLINEKNLSWIHISLPMPHKQNQILNL